MSTFTDLSQTVFVSITTTNNVSALLKCGAESPGDWRRMSNLPRSEVTRHFGP